MSTSTHIEAEQTLRQIATAHIDKPTGAERDELIKQEALMIGQASDAPMHSIVRALAESVFQNHRLLPVEFYAKFQNLKLAEILVEGFMQNLHRMTIKNVRRIPEAFDPQSPDYNLVHSRLRDFIERYDGIGFHTLTGFIRSHTALYPDVLIALVFDNDPSLRRLLVEKINLSAEGVANQAYDTLYQQDPDQFALHILLTRVITFQDGKLLHVNTKNLDALFVFLHQKKYQLSRLYQVLHTQRSSLMNVLKLSSVIRQEVTRSAPGLLSEPSEDGTEPGILDPSFDYHAFFMQYFKGPTFAAAKSPAPRTIRLIDLFKLHPESVMVPAEHLSVIATHADKSSHDFMEVKREYLGYLQTGEHRRDISDELVNELITEQLDRAEEQIDSHLTTGLSKRNDPEIHLACTPIPGIIACRDLHQLMKWISKPEQYLVDFPPQEGEIPPEPSIIRFEARLLLWFFNKCRLGSFDDQRKVAHQKRDLLESDLRARLHIKETTAVTKIFRITEDIDPASGEPVVGKNGRRAYGVLTPESPEWPKYISDTERHIPEGKDYVIYPVEKRTFQKGMATVKLPDGTMKTFPVYFYSKDEHIFQIKPDTSSISRAIRGRPANDEIRGSAASDVEEDRTLLRETIYKYAAGGNAVIKDSVDQRYIRDGGSPRERTEGSASYAERRDLNAQMTATIAVNTAPPERAPTTEDIDHVLVPFELQVLPIKEMLISGSDHTITSHEHTFVPEREFETVFKILRPPAVYGQKYAKYYLQGFKGDKQV